MPAAADTTKDLVAALQQLNGAEGPAPQVRLQPPTYDGSEKDRFSFVNFLNRFTAVVDTVPSMSTRYKLVLLQASVTGEAAKQISGLPVNDDNYEVALTALKARYLNKPLLRDALLKQIVYKTPSHDYEYEGTHQYLIETKNTLNDLKLHYNADLLIPGSGGYQLVSSIVFSKLPFDVQRLLIMDVSTNFPTLDQIFDRGGEIVETLVRTRFRKTDRRHSLSNGSTPKREGGYKN